jgi:hypothetical protein
MNWNGAKEAIVAYFRYYPAFASKDLGKPQKSSE